MIKIIFLIISFLILFLPNKDYNLMSKENTLVFKGIFCIIVILHHLSQFENNIIMLHIFSNFGMYAVSAFFFISAYGMTKQLKSDKERYLSNFFKNRFVKLLVPILIVTFIHIILNILIFNKEYTLNYILSVYKNGSSIINNGWYLNSILVIYLMFYFSFKFFKNVNISYLVFSFLIILYMYILNRIGFGIWWYNSMFAILFGMLYEVFEVKIKYLLDIKIYSILYFLSIVSFCIFNNAEDRILNFISRFGINLDYSIVQNLICINFLILFFLISKKFDFRSNIKADNLYLKISLFRNKILSFLGKISFEMYMIHGFIMNVLYLFLRVNFIYMFLMFLFTIIISYFLNNIFKKIYRILKLNNY